MKLIIAIVNNDDARKVMDELNSNGFSVTRLCSTGGFLKSGNTTLLVGVDENSVDNVLQIIHNKSKSRKQVKSSSAKADGIPVSGANEIVIGGATVFVTDVERFEKV